MTAEVLDRPGMEGAKVDVLAPAADPLRPGRPLGRLGRWHARPRLLRPRALPHGRHRQACRRPALAFDRIANGLPGLETRLPLLFDAMVTKGKGGPEAFARLTATAPARLYGLKGKGEIAPGFDADLVLWDPARRVTYGADDLHDNAGYNPWEGHTVTGWPETVLLRGEVIADGGQCRATPGTGRRVPRPAPGFAATHPPAPEVRFLESLP
jgi:dihydropyrimidinase